MVNRNDLVRNKLIEITDKGLMLKAIAVNVGIDVNDLSRFKGGMECLKKSDVEVLSKYLMQLLSRNGIRSYLKENFYKTGFIAYAYEEIKQENRKK